MVVLRSIGLVVFLFVLKEKLLLKNNVMDAVVSPCQHI